MDRKWDAPEPVPPAIEFAPTGHDHPIALATDVVETPPEQPEREDSVQ